MDKVRFKPVMLLAIVIPVLVSWAGYTLLYSNQEKQSVAVSSAPQAGDPILVNKPQASATTPQTSTIDYQSLLLYLALLAGAVALIGHYLRSSLVWLAVIALPLGFSLLYFSKFQLTLLNFYLANLALAALLALLILRLFYLRAFLRLRMIVCSVVAAGLLTLYLRALYLITGTAFPAGGLSQFYVPALIMFIFVTFGLSLADMVILRSLYGKELRRAREQTEADEDDA
ncbi:MAG TPA: hypothetical protein PKH19_03350 [Candidatus Syntrophosphaera sp.]|nr:hypothetical protein [Candidatus Syntrophosphaera sp.]